MAGLRAWTRDRRVIRDSSGRVLLCEDCPCPTGTGTGTGTGTAHLFDLGTGTGTNERGVLATDCCPGVYIPGHLWLTFECLSSCTVCLADFSGTGGDFFTNPIQSYPLIYRGQVSDAAYPTPFHTWETDDSLQWDGLPLGRLKCIDPDNRFVLLNPWATITYSSPSTIPDIFVCDPFYIEWSDVGSNPTDCGGVMRFRVSISEVAP